MTNLKTTKIGLAALTIIFLLLYGYFSTLGKPASLQLSPNNQGFADSKIVLGNLGGFHIIKNISSSDENQFYRLIIDTELNRSTASPEDITIPYTVFEETAAANSSEANASSSSDLYLIRVICSDTQVENIPQDKPLAVFNNASGDAKSPQLINEVRVKSNQDETSEITIQLSKKSLFRATADNVGTIVLDILK